MLRKYTVIHHSVTDSFVPSLKKKYHLILYKKGNSVSVIQGVPDHISTTFAVGGANSICYSVCLVGNFESLKPDSDLVFHLVQALVVKIKSGFAPLNITGHSQVGMSLPRPYFTQCPGQHLIALFPHIRSEVKKRL